MRDFVRVSGSRAQDQQLPDIARRCRGYRHFCRSIKPAGKAPIAGAIGTFMVSGSTCSVDVVVADVDRAQTQAGAGLNHLLLIAVADAGVDREAAEAEAVAPAVSPAAMEAMRGSGCRSSDAERSGG